MKSGKILLISLLLLTFTFSILSAQEVTPAGKKLKMKKLAFEGIPAGAQLLEAAVVGDEILYAFSSTEPAASPPDSNEINFVSLRYAGQMMKIYHGIPAGYILALYLNYNFGEQPAVEGVTIVAAVRSRVLDLVRIDLVAVSLSLAELQSGTEKPFGEAINIHQNYHNPGELISIVGVPLVGRSSNGRTEILATVNYQDQTNAPYHNNSKAFALSFDQETGFSESIIPIVIPGNGKNTHVTFTPPSDKLVVAYRQKSKNPPGGYPFPQADGGTILTGKNTPSFNYSTPPATKIRIKDRIKTPEPYLNLPLRETRLIKLKDSSPALIYQHLTPAWSSTSKAKTDYYFTKISDAARPAGGIKKITWPEWKRQVKESNSVSAYHHFSIPSEYISLGNGNYCLLEAFNFMRKPYNSPSPAAKPQHTEVQGRILVFDSGLLQVKTSKDLKIAFDEYDFLSRCWALERGDSIDFLIMLQKDGRDEYETSIGTVKKADIK